MIIVKVENNLSLDKALKILKNKVHKTKQLEFLKDRKQYEKKSVKLRNQKRKAIHKQNFINSH